ncbi:hypothetical protein [Rhodococcus daqingensis]|uniref:Uncharacterized protein n=1 Tax=Rhodococcus daqingensis TaxID=2479363 RepID=A0ABW2S1N1_9NOCA
MDAIEIRTEALSVRREIETISRDLWSTFITTPKTRHTAVKIRLTLVAARIEPGLQRAAMAAAQRVAEVYSETSDVLHGRTRSVLFTTYRVADWRRDLERLHAFLPGSSIPTATAGDRQDEHLDTDVTP